MKEHNAIKLTPRSYYYIFTQFNKVFYSVIVSAFHNVQCKATWIQHVMNIEACGRLLVVKVHIFLCISYISYVFLVHIFLCISDSYIPTAFFRAWQNKQLTNIPIFIIYFNLSIQFIAAGWDGRAIKL